MKNLTVHGKHLEEPHDEAQLDSLVVVRVGVQRPTDHDSQGREIYAWLVENLPFETWQRLAACFGSK
jgi:hypothetical protein